MKRCLRVLKVTSIFLVLSSIIISCGGKEEKKSESDGPNIAPQKMADALFAVMKGTRTAYTKHVIARLGKEKKLIKPDEKWKDIDNGVMLPAQMFRYGRDLAMEKKPGFTYSLQSKWPINSKNKPSTPMEVEGLDYVAKNPGKNFYGTEEINGKSFYTAVYPDVAVSPACIDCHNEHKDSPRKDFKMDEVMGGVVIRIPMN